MRFSETSKPPNKFKPAEEPYDYKQNQDSGEDVIPCVTDLHGREIVQLW
jgi:hypothetical protein